MVERVLDVVATAFRTWIIGLVLEGLFSNVVIEWTSLKRSVGRWEGRDALYAITLWVFGFGRLGLARWFAVDRDFGQWLDIVIYGVDSVRACAPDRSFRVRVGWVRLGWKPVCTFPGVKV